METELLTQLVAIDSVNPVYGGPGEAGVADFVCGWLEARGIRWTRQPVLPGRDNVYARIGPAEAPALLLEAHMDTVGVDGWGSGSAFELQERGGRWFGRGACDTKASLACFLSALAHFHQSPETLGRGLVLAATVDEESDQLGAFKLAELKASLGIAWAITGEPTRSSVISRHKGAGRYGIEVSGKAAHGSTPELGENAVYKAARLCGRVQALAESLGAAAGRREIERGTLNLGSIRGGIGFNIVPDHCEIDIDRRLGAGETAEAAREELEAICRSETGVGLKVYLERPPLRGTGSEAFVADILAAAEKAGVASSEREVPFMTNAVAYEAVGIPAAVFGPGDIAQAHKNDEFIERGELGRCSAVLRALLAKR